MITRANDVGNLKIADSADARHSENLRNALLVDATTQGSVDEANPKNRIYDFDDRFCYLR